LSCCARIEYLASVSEACQAFLWCPYKLVRRIGEVSFELGLPPGIRIHHVFHVSELKPYHGDPITTGLRVPTSAEYIKYYIWNLVIQPINNSFSFHNLRVCCNGLRAFDSFCPKHSLGSIYVLDWWMYEAWKVCSSKYLVCSWFFSFPS
jgi:hypothetical protein